MSILSAVRGRSISTFLLMVAIASALLAVPAVASVADPYPPTTCSSSPGNSVTGGSCSAAASTSAARSSESSAPDSTDSTASTGFQALTATAIAGALLAGGVAFVLFGRKRRHG